jgi:hypothetical protein
LSKSEISRSRWENEPIGERSPRILATARTAAVCSGTAAEQIASVARGGSRVVTARMAALGIPTQGSRFRYIWM